MLFLASKPFKKAERWGWETGQGISEAKDMTGMKSKEGCGEPAAGGTADAGHRLQCARLGKKTREEERRARRLSLVHFPRASRKEIRSQGREGRGRGK